MIIGLTGKSCSGKNFASEYMEKLGWKVLDLDVIGHNILEQKSSDILKLFGTTDRKEIGKIVFNDVEKRTQLESLLYPEMVEIILQEDRKNPIVVANGALLHRAAIDRICRYVVYIDSSYPVRLMRAMKRDNIQESVFKLRDDAQNDVHYNDVVYESELVIIDNNINGMEQLEKFCESVSSGRGIL